MEQSRPITSGRQRHWPPNWSQVSLSAPTSWQAQGIAPLLKKADRDTAELRQNGEAVDGLQGGGEERKICTATRTGPALTLPDSAPVNVHLHRVVGVERLVIVENEDITSQSMDTGGVHRCILGRLVTLVEGQRRSGYRGGQEGLLYGGALALLQDQRGDVVLVCPRSRHVHRDRQSLWQFFLTGIFHDQNVIARRRQTPSQLNADLKHKE
ncbi:hypothetical protein EYF80_009696 [Liparis tanakae]|uniref:Uncharacterized protein n=1 Tax=Liparis tanakae TaxID=230148 RepID=A0A4Z2IQ59_9TELE|nr:hypothetical protein EYF80_009696 [Liparis tanakae]